MCEKWRFTKFDRRCWDFITGCALVLSSSLSPTMANPLPGQGTQRQGSLRSVASNSSIASGTSLTRRARTRARSKTLTGGSSARSDKLQSPISELPYLDKVNVQEPLEQSSPSPLGAPPRPPRSPHRTETMGGQIATMQASGDDSHSPATELYVEDPQSYPMPNGRLVRIRPRWFELVF
jgi:hypothetical protein